MAGVPAERNIFCGFPTNHVASFDMVNIFVSSNSYNIMLSPFCPAGPLSSSLYE
jgi:hypothetical protein